MPEQIVDCLQCITSFKTLQCSQCLMTHCPSCCEGLSCSFLPLYSDISLQERNKILKTMKSFKRGETYDEDYWNFYKQEYESYLKYEKEGCDTAFTEKTWPEANYTYTREWRNFKTSTQQVIIDETRFDIINLSDAYTMLESLSQFLSENLNYITFLDFCYVNCFNYVIYRGSSYTVKMLSPAAHYLLLDTEHNQVYTAFLMTGLNKFGPTRCAETSTSTGNSVNGFSTIISDSSNSNIRVSLNTRRMTSFIPIKYGCVTEGKSNKQLRDDMIKKCKASLKKIPVTGAGNLCLNKALQIALIPHNIRWSQNYISEKLYETSLKEAQMMEDIGIEGEVQTSYYRLETLINFLQDINMTLCLHGTIEIFSDDNPVHIDLDYFVHEGVTVGHYTPLIPLEFEDIHKIVGEIELDFLKNYLNSKGINKPAADVADDDVMSNNDDEEEGETKKEMEENKKQKNVIIEDDSDQDTPDGEVKTSNRYADLIEKIKNNNINTLQLFEMIFQDLSNRELFEAIYYNLSPEQLNAFQIARNKRADNTIRDEVEKTIHKTFLQLTWIEEGPFTYEYCKSFLQDEQLVIIAEAEANEQPVVDIMDHISDVSFDGLDFDCILMDAEDEGPELVEFLMLRKEFIMSNQLCFKDLDGSCDIMGDYYAALETNELSEPSFTSQSAEVDEEQEDAKENDTEQQDFTDEIGSENEMIDSNFEWANEFNNDQVESQLEGDPPSICATCNIDEVPILEHMPGLYEELVGETITPFNLECALNMYKELSMAINFMAPDFFSDKMNKGEINLFLNSIANFFHFRHDLFTLPLSMALQKHVGNSFSTDKLFTELFPEINSKRTPDIIFRIEDTVVVVETSVTNDSRKSLLQKGSTVADSKYKEELSYITRQGCEVEYHSLYMDVNTAEDTFRSILDHMLNKNYIINPQQSITVYERIKRCLLENRMAEKYGYLIFGTQSVKFGGLIHRQGNETLELFEKNAGLKKKMTTRSMLMKMNEYAVNLIKLNAETLMNQLYNPRFDEKKVKLFCTQKDVNIRFDMLGMEPEVILKAIKNNDLYSIRGAIMIQDNNNKNLWYESDKRGPFVSLTVKGSVRAAQFSKNDHEHTHLALKVVPKIFDQLPRINYEIEEELNEEVYTKCNELNQKKLLTNFKVDQTMFKKSAEQFNEQMEAVSKSFQNKGHNPKSIFTLPFCEAKHMLKTKDLLSEMYFPHTATQKLIFEPFKNNPDKLVRRTFNPEAREEMSQLNKKFTTAMKISASLMKKDRVNFKLAKLGLKEMGEIKMLKELTEIHDKLNEKNRSFKKTHIEEKEFRIVNLSKTSMDAIKKEYSWTAKKYENVNRHFDKIEESLNEEVFNGLISCMFNEQENVDYSDYIDKICETGVDTESMTRLKEITMMKMKTIMHSHKKRSVLLMSDFVSQFIYTLMYFSKSPLKGNQFIYSNLGWEGVALIVRGGKSVNKTGDSRQFRMQYPIPAILYKYRNILFSQSYDFNEEEGISYCLTPWMQLNEKVLTDMINCREKVFMNLTTYINRVSEESNKIHLHNIGFNFLLMFNNRRQTEMLLADLRYPIVNSMGLYSNIPDLMSSLASDPSDFIQYNVLSKVAKYETFAKKLNSNDKEVKPVHWFTERELLGKTDLTFLIYCTYMMTKAPYKQHIEQSKNLEGLMKSRLDFIKLMDGDLKPQLSKVLGLTETDDPAKIFDNDFYFSPKFSFSLGKRLSSYLKSKESVNDINNAFYVEFTRGWYNIENDSGLRSDKLQKKTVDSFFGRKSHEVVASEMLQLLSEGMKPEEALNKIRGELPDLFTKSKKLSSYDINFVEMINKKEGQVEFIFHVVDKTQWKGNREIYVMTMWTKIHQNPLEGFFAKICQKVENEIISVPSDRRSMLIHGQLFENKFVKNAKVKFNRYNLSLDCRKWGPKTNFNKYLYFIMGMADILPLEFLIYFAYFVKHYNSKQVVISPKAVKVFLNNERLKEYKKYFEEEEGLETMKFTMPESFIMGIFNYLSSLYHAVAQMEAIDKITDIMYKKYGVMTIMKMNAHSDDSAGYILIPTTKQSKGKENEILKEMVSLYEVILKFGNMFLSLKKCTISSRYFELLSILYIDDKLLPMVPKFYGSMVLKPTMGGYSRDVNQGYSKTIELIQNGATFAEAYLAMRIMSMIYRGFYHLNNVDTDRPISAYGSLYSHPLMVLLTGAKSDNIRLYKSNKEKFIKYQSVMAALTGESKEAFKQQGFIPQQRMDKRRSVNDLIDKAKSLFGVWVLPKKGDVVYSSKEPTNYFDLTYNYDDSLQIYRVTDVNNSVYIVNNDKEFRLEVPEEIKISKSLYLKSFLTRILHLVNGQLNDPDFLASLSYASNTRRLSQLFTTAANINLKTTLGLQEQKKLPLLVQTLVEDPDVLDDLNVDKESFLSIYHKMTEVSEKLYEDILGEADHVYEYISNTVFTDTFVERNTRQNRLQIKPCHIQMDLNTNAVTTKEDPMKIFYSDSPGAWIFNPGKSLIRDKLFLDNRLKELGLDYNDAETFSYYVRNLTSSAKKEFNLYAYVSSSNRQIMDFDDLTQFLETNSIFNHRLVKLYKNFKMNKKLLNLNVRLDEPTLKCLQLSKIQSYCVRNYNHNETKYMGRTIEDFCKTKLGPIAAGFYPEKANNMEDLNWFYAWKKTQLKGENKKWFGPGVLIIKTPNTIIQCDLQNNYLERIYTECDPLILQSSMELNIMIFVLNALGVKFLNKLSMNTNNLVLTNEIRLSISTEKSCNFNWAAVIQDPGLSSVRYSKHFHMLNQWQYKVDQLKWNSISLEYPLILNDEELSSLPKQLAARIEDKEESTFKNHLELVSKMKETDFYQYMILDKLSISPYKIEKVLAESCKKNGLNFEGIQKMKIEEILQRQLNLDLLPDDLYQAVLNSESYFKIKGCYDEFVTDIASVLIQHEDDRDWNSLQSKWGKNITSELTSLQVRRVKNMDLLDNPQSVWEKSYGTSRNAVMKLEHALVKLVDEGLGQDLISPDMGSFIQLQKWTSYHMKCFNYLIRRESSVQSLTELGVRHSRLSMMLHEIYNEIFSNNYYFTRFKKIISEDDLLDSMLISSDNSKKWAIMHYVFAAKNTRDNRGMTSIKEYNSYEKTIRMPGHEEQPTFKGPDSDFKPTYMFLARLPHKRIINKDNKGKKINMKVEFTSYNIDNPFQLPTGHPNFNYNFTASSDIINEMNVIEHFPTSTKNLIERYKKEGKIKCTEKQPPLPYNAKEATIPVIEMVGGIEMCRVASSFNHAIIITTTLPSDINRYYEDCRVHYGPIICGVNQIITGCAYYITYRINFDILKHCFGLLPLIELKENSINEIYFDRMKKDFVLYHKGTFSKAENSEIGSHSHDCSQLYRKYETNPQFKECFMKVLANKEKLDMDIYNRYIRKIDDFCESKTTYANAVYNMDKMLNEMDKHVSHNDQLYEVLKTVMADSKQMNDLKIKLEDIGGKRIRNYSDQFSTNDYSPIDRNSKIYQDLSVIFGSGLDLLLNRGLNLKMSSKRRLLLDLEGKMAVYKLMHENFFLNTMEYKASVLFLKWLQAMLLDCNETVDDDDFVITMENALNQSHEQLLTKVDDINTLYRSGLDLENWYL